MHPIQTTGGSNLNIYIAAPPIWTYVAGDTIIGSVNRHLHIVTPDAKISVTLIGRTKARLITAGYPSKTTYYGDWELFNLPQTLLRGPIHIPSPSTQTDWINIPFSINIPEAASLSTIHDHAQEESFISLEANIIAQHPLPGSFSTEWTGAKVCIEYYVQAQLQYMHNGSWQVERATAPITLGYPTVDADEIWFAQQRCSIVSRVRSQRLLPWMRDVDLSLMQRTQKILGLASVPGFSFEVVMSVPVAIQLNNSSPIPLVIRIIPQREGSSSAIWDVVQRVDVTAIKMTILSKVEIVLQPTVESLYRVPDDEYVFVQQLGLEKAFEQLKDPVVTFAGPADTPVDIGRVLRLVLRNDGLMSDGRCLSRLASIQPSFVTFNTRLSHSIIWQISVSIAGETRTVSMETAVTVYNSASRL
ncbi:uncharacterized protein PGRI_070160 [Penicillium griseofulvum]|uniref:Arrestin-like N-terminal domain-containing protein n=1 Tax=Penicillium patulum TaxID=5078 RepID=A0A135LNJ4_PENPA|nr:uncharacterized protein PGRI_070160 [Penicillium griseofulvum]KXG50525.1 hypothetical protein PGRI_070160 [Penicillium griseofulvum]